MKVLAIDTSNYVLGVSLVENETVIGEYITNVKGNHSVRTMPAIQELMESCGVMPSELDRIVVAEGPGSYTGLRIGVTIAKTMAWTLNIPIAGVSSLKALAANGSYFQGYICPLFDARRGQVYTGLFQYEQQELKRISEDQNILLSSFLQELKQQEQRILFIGNDVEMHKETIKEELGEKAVFADASEHNPRPSKLGLLGMRKEAVGTHSFVPNYIRLAEAEAKWLESQK
ncbi:tRNA (adenosine(37)-N6)-threonylcarbamoyltransferase complex dimerization subunit type 1 TsaB [Bacillus lacus]|uniref:tRNA (Adenosine(37)-N6)-threonylcarbamoyltransferase complex dimerization subunit type 1 TsaB n=1 Tax=Metabacillus lacus TaxID=1983721 RepID=A0A7X2IZV9_9BACI|nr:tRNA (adenosine(37)-N6)-threonylcarbamoyltransferase complex dimerization subunit type 1 TsaB [Metabacillus lacus]MRX72760.1 tRNA (adenosine(37)-N6)-threonylcarbamoyltransferase complex dimerization subunit type 1 TsaB [Metabacillus lacus]